MSSLLLPNTAEGASAGAELVTSDGRSLALVSALLRGEAQGGLARLVLEQTFANTFDENLRVTYRMPLPADGAVSGYEFVVGDRVVRGTIDRKARARERFERAIVEGRTAALLEQERADIFTQQIGNIPPRETIVARITIDQRLVWLPEGEWELRFPTVIGPRYIGSADTAADVRATHVKVTEEPLKARVQIALSIRDAIAGGGTPSSPSHHVDRAADGTIALSTGARLDRDIVLRWPVATPAVGLSLAAARPAQGNDAFGLLTIVPPARDAKPIAVARDLIVLVDTSGSMSGGPLDKAKQVICMMLDSLDADDRFELIEFSNQPHRYLDEPVVATAKAKQAAIKWVRNLEADGATEMRAAVIEAMTSLRVGAQRQVVVVTDGYVGGEKQILEAMNRRLPKSCRVHVLGVGSAVNRSLATSLARAGRGVEVIVGLDEDAERGAKRLLDRTRMPVLTNVEISGSALLRHAPELMPDVFEGAPLVAALALRPDGGELVVRGQGAREAWVRTITVPAQQPGTGNQAIVALYGRERVADVEAHALFSSVDGEIEELGLQFQIATRMTSWVAIDETRRVTGPFRDQLIPQELPYGTSAAAFGLRGASPAQSTKAGMMLGSVGMFEQAEGMASYDARSPLDLDDDVTESAPAGRFDADEEIAPAPRSLQAAPRAPMKKAYSADDFEREEPTSRRDHAANDKGAPEEKRELARARRSTTVGAPPPAAQAPAAPARGGKAPTAPSPTVKPVPARAASAPPPSEPAAPVPPQPAPAAPKLSAAAPSASASPSLPQELKLAEPLPQPPRRSLLPPWLAALAILALIALLLWWLLA